MEHIGKELDRILSPGVTHVVRQHSSLTKPRLYLIIGPPSYERDETQFHSRKKVGRSKLMSEQRGFKCLQLSQDK